MASAVAFLARLATPDGAPTAMGSLAVSGNPGSSPAPLHLRTSNFEIAARYTRGGSLKWANGPVVPRNSTSPYAGAHYMYHRDDLGAASYGLPRLSPFDLEVIVWGANNNTITTRPDVASAVRQGVNTIYFWNSSYWATGFREGGWPPRAAAQVAGNKSNLFWEELAQQLAQRIFGISTPYQPVYLYGPACVAPTGKVTCARPNITDASRVAVKTTISASRDDIMPVSRSIYLFAERRPWKIYDVTYSVDVPAGIRIASPWQETLDMRPFIGGHRLSSAVVTVLADSPRTRYRC